MKKMYVLAAVFIQTALFANIGPEGFIPYPNDYFVETGTCGGGGIFKALGAGFKDIRSMDCDYGHVRFVKQRFANFKQVKVRLGDSAKDLWDMIQDIERPITFWLDAHVFPPLLDGTRNCPLIEELEQIRWHPIKTHTILIDDMCCAGSAAFDYFTKEDIIYKIREINPLYEISYIAGGDQGEVENNILVAKVPQEK